MSTYTIQPKLPPEISERYETILQTLNGAMTVTAAAEKLGLSRVQCHTLMNRAAAGVLEALLPRKPGRPATPVRQRELEAEVEQLRRENARLQDRVETIDRLMTVAGGILRGQVRTSRPRTAKKKATSNEPEDPDGAARRKVEESTELRRIGVRAALAAALVGMSASTMRRWRQRLRAGAPARRRCGPARGGEPAPEKQRELEQAVRALRGVSGAASLAHAVGVSRRAAARIKRRVLTEMERERVARCTRLLVTEPGVLRSLDQLYIGARPAQRIALIASDASVPQRTSAQLASSYCAEEVARVLSEDFARHGAPLVVRMDRASAHDAPPVRALLRAHEVLLLQGPPRYPRYYGQHERQNREHRAWLALAGQVDDDVLAEMLSALNERWLRPSLGWRTAAEIWDRRRELRINRTQLRREVVSRESALRARLGPKKSALRLAGRLAIEQALEDRGLVRRIQGGWC
jgi:Helix-turn-helix domain